MTGGGVPLAEVKTEGCASLRCPGLYLSGEVLDAAGTAEALTCNGPGQRESQQAGPRRGAVKKQNARG